MTENTERGEGVVSELTDALRQVGGLTCNAAAAEIERLRAEVERYRETNRRLNARAQAAEKAVHEKIAKYPHRSLGRALANTAADMYRRERDAARAERDNLRDLCGQALARMLPVYEGTANVEIALLLDALVFAARETETEGES